MITWSDDQVAVSIGHFPGRVAGERDYFIFDDIVRQAMDLFAAILEDDP